MLWTTMGWAAPSATEPILTVRVGDLFIDPSPYPSPRRGRGTLLQASLRALFIETHRSRGVPGRQERPRPGRGSAGSGHSGAEAVVSATVCYLSYWFQNE